MLPLALLVRVVAGGGLVLCPRNSSPEFLPGIPSHYYLPYASHYNRQGLAVGDINGDGLNDIVVADYNHGLLMIYNDPQVTPWGASLAIEKAGTGDGTVTSSPRGISCGADCKEDYVGGAVVTLSASPASNSTFIGWSGDPDWSDGIVTMIADKTCVANFIQGRVALLAPNGGEIWPVGSKQKISWSVAFGPSIPNLRSFRIDLSRDGGQTWMSLVKKTGNSLLKVWKVTKPATTQAKIRICSTGSPSVCDTSDNFTIR